MTHRQKSQSFRFAAAFMLCCAVFAVFMTSGCGTEKNGTGRSPETENKESSPDRLWRSTQPAPPPISPPGRTSEKTQSGAARHQGLFGKARKSKPKKVNVKGIYVSGPVAGGSGMNRLIELADSSEINAMVIDVKDDAGRITHNSAVPLANRIGANRRAAIRDIRALLAKLKRHQIYAIARVVAFKDPYLAAGSQQLAMRRKSGGVWKDRSGVMWVDPYDERVQRYVIDVAMEAARIGFDEVQFDYVRFPDSGRNGREVQFRNTSNLTKAQMIERFLHNAYEQLDPLGVYVSADVFGLTTTAADDMGIGQSWNLLADEVDVISPMIYPSHYAPGSYGYRHPDLHPKGVVKRALADGLDRTGTMRAQKKAAIRPWLQGFTATWIDPHLQYGKKQVGAQIEAAGELGINQYLLWNPRCEYHSLIIP